jgi:hypothetical protein
MTKRKPVRSVGECIQAANDHFAKADNDTKAPAVSKNAGKQPGDRDTKAPAAKRAPKRRSPAADLAPATGTPPEGRSAATGQSPVALDDPQRRLDHRWADASEVGRLNGIFCTGSPDEPTCEEPAALGITKSRRLFSLPCRTHMPDVLGPLLRQGWDDVTTIALASLLEVHGDKLKTSAAYIREFNRTNGVYIPQRGEQ